MAKNDMPHFANLRDGELVKFNHSTPRLTKAVSAFREAVDLLVSAWRKHG